MQSWHFIFGFVGVYAIAKLFWIFGIVLWNLWTERNEFVKKMHDEQAVDEYVRSILNRVIITASVNALITTCVYALYLFRSLP